MISTEIPSFETVTAPLAHWARERPDALALADETRQWTFAQLAQAVQMRADEIKRQRAPSMAWVRDVDDTAVALIDFLAVVASGRAAAIGDPGWPPAVRQGVQAWVDSSPADVPAPGPLSPFYVGFTSGSTGLPKGFRRHHRSWTESLRIGLETFGDVAATRVLAPGRLSHSLFLFGMVQGLWTGAGVLVQQQFSAARSLAWLAAGQAQCLVAVPSQLALMLEVAARRSRKLGRQKGRPVTPIDATRLILISGARWMRQRTPELRALFPNARIVEFYGASEASFIAWTDADENLPPAVVGRPFSNVDISIRDASQPEGNALNGLDGLIYVRSPMLFMDYVGEPDGSSALREPSSDGSPDDWLSVRDMGHLDSEGRLCMAGRQQRMIVTRGKNLFPEEVENLLSAHPAIEAASVQGVDDALRGKIVVALIRRKSGVDTAIMPTAAELAAWCRQSLEVYKVPRHFWLCADWPQTASGKTHHARLAQLLASHEDAIAMEATETTEGNLGWQRL